MLDVVRVSVRVRVSVVVASMSTSMGIHMVGIRMGIVRVRKVIKSRHIHRRGVMRVRSRRGVVYRIHMYTAHTRH